MTLLGLINIMNMIMRGMALGTEVASLVRAGRDALNQMVDEDRDPTPEELDEIFNRVKERQERIRDAMS